MLGSEQGRNGRQTFINILNARIPIEYRKGPLKGSQDGNCGTVQRGIWCIGVGTEQSSIEVVYPDQMLLVVH